MFTGIVEGTREVVGAERSNSGLKLEIDLGDLASGVSVGDSIAVNGCCLTVENLEGSVARFHIADESLGLTTLDEAESGVAVNIERSLKAGDPLGGHFVTGHVDGVGRILEIVAGESETCIKVSLPSALCRQVIHKGSVALDGVSLTLTEVAKDHVAVMLIPHTLEITTLGVRQVGDGLNVETDMIGKWVGHHLGPVVDRKDESRGGEDSP